MNGLIEREVYRQPDGPLITVEEYRPSSPEERRRWHEIRNREAYEAWRRKRNRVTR